MATAAVLRKDDGIADPRGALREAIAGAREARASVVQYRDAVERAENLVMENRRKLETATRAVATARNDDVVRLAEAIADGGTVSVKKARAAEDDARDISDTFEAARKAVTKLKANLKEAEDAVGYTDRAVDRALAILLEPVARSLLERVHDLTARRARAQASVTALGSLWDPGTEISRRIDSTSATSDTYRHEMVAGRKEMQDALEALKRDPDAKLPDLGD